MFGLFEYIINEFIFLHCLVKLFLNVKWMWTLNDEHKDNNNKNDRLSDLKIRIQTKINTYKLEEASSVERMKQ